MIRAILEEVLLFLVPFVVFGAILVAMRRNPFRLESWSKRGLALTIAGLLFAIAGLILFGFTAERSTGVYEPAHMENGRLVPGRVR
jgi:multisubunit Na+/H+ antiporter MnhB subunit